MNDTSGMMNHTDGWMSGWMGGGMWLWTVIGVLVVVLLVVLIVKLSKKHSCVDDPPSRLTVKHKKEIYAGQIIQ